MKPQRLFYIIFLALMLTASSAWALSLDQAKSQGLIGELRNGYIGAVNTQSGEVQSLVAGINKERKQQYQEISKKNRVDITSVEILAAQKALEQTRAGNFIQQPSGGWVKK